MRAAVTEEVFPMRASRFPLLRIRGRTVLPVVQGGLAQGVCAHRLAGAVAREGAVGTIEAVELRRLHPDIMRRTRRCRDHGILAASNLEALDREIRAAREIAGPDGYIAVSVMRASNHYGDLVRQSCESGADAIVMGAGMPFDLPELVKGFDHVALIPILSEERSVRALLQRWMCKGRLPDAIIMEHPRYAGGYLGVPRLEQANEDWFDFGRILSAVQTTIRQLGLPVERIPLIPTGGINSFEKLRTLFAMGADAVQLSTPFAVTREGDAHPGFKRVLTEANPRDTVTFLSSAGLPVRAVLTPWLEQYLKREDKLRWRVRRRRRRCPRNVQCLSHCGLKDANPAAGQFCIETHLAAAQRGDVKRGLFFRGAESLPFGNQIRPVRDLLEYLLTGGRPEAYAPA